MNYETMCLTLSTADARRLIERRVPGVKVSEVGGYVEYRSPLGYHLAELTSTTLPNENPGTRLKYRTAMVSPTAANARRTADRIRAAVETHRYRE